MTSPDAYWRRWSSSCSRSFSYTPWGIYEDGWPLVIGAMQELVFPMLTVAFAHA
jgi:hypothetical protein